MKEIDLSALDDLEGGSLTRRRKEPKILLILNEWTKGIRDPSQLGIRPKALKRA